LSPLRLLLGLQRQLRSAVPPPLLLLLLRVLQRQRRTAWVPMSQRM
jgi:hypothetical protein